jgi:hypothetical protein
MKRANRVLHPHVAACHSPACFEVAPILVLTRDIEMPLCPVHWSALRSSSRGEFRVLEELDRPPCIKRGCEAGAVSVMRHPDQRPLPVCEEHLEDLSRVTPSPVELAEIGSRA